MESKKPYFVDDDGTPISLTGDVARRTHLNNLLAKLDTPGATPRKTRERLQQAGKLAAIELLKKNDDSGHTGTKAS